MYYDYDKESFSYYCDVKDISYLYLETVVRKYAINFNCKKYGIEEYPAAYYEEFLAYVKSKYQGQYWHVLPREMARFWSRTMV